jgi:hypothetical protein
MIQILGTEFVHFYLLEEDGEITLVDAGVSGYRDTLEPALAGMGRSIDDVKAIVLTHATPPATPTGTASCTHRPITRCSSAMPSTTSTSSPASPARRSRLRPRTPPPTGHLNLWRESKTSTPPPSTSVTETHPQRAPARS